MESPELETANHTPINPLHLRFWLFHRPFPTPDCCTRPPARRRPEPNSSADLTRKRTTSAPRVVSDWTSSLAAERAFLQLSVLPNGPSDPCLARIVLFLAAASGLPRLSTRMPVRSAVLCRLSRKSRVVASGFSPFLAAHAAYHAASVAVLASGVPVVFLASGLRLTLGAAPGCCIRGRHLY